MNPVHFDSQRLENLLEMPRLIDAMAAAFSGAFESPPRSQYRIGNDRLLIMPSWQAGRFVGSKLVTYLPENRKRGLPTIHGLYVLFDLATGEARATMDGGRLTLLRTSATSALAARHLARGDASTLLLVGAGSLAPYLARAHCAVRPIQEVLIWNRSPSAALLLADRVRTELQLEASRVRVVEHLEAAVPRADIISTATSSHDPLVRGKWISPGTHLDLVGAFTPLMCEVDGDALVGNRVVVDTWEGADEEAGDILRAIDQGVLARSDLAGDLASLVSRSIPGRQSAAEITVFKSVGASQEDLAAAVLAFETAREDV